MRLLVPLNSMSLPWCMIRSMIAEASLSSHEHHAPFRELDVGGDDEAAPLVAVAHDLEQEPRALLVERDVAELVDDEEPGSRDVFHELLEPMLSVRARQGEHQLGGGEEPHLQPRVHAGEADGYRQVRLAPPRLPVEDEVLRRVDERKRLQVVDGVALRQDSKLATGSQQSHHTGCSHCIAITIPVRVSTILRHNLLRSRSRSNMAKKALILVLAIPCKTSVRAASNVQRLPNPQFAAFARPLLQDEIEKR